MLFHHLTAKQSKDLNLLCRNYCYEYLLSYKKKTTITTTAGLKQSECKQLDAKLSGSRRGQNILLCSLKYVHFLTTEQELHYSSKFDNKHTVMKSDS